MKSMKQWVENERQSTDTVSLQRDLIIHCTLRHVHRLSTVLGTHWLLNDSSRVNEQVNVSVQYAHRCFLLIPGGKTPAADLT